MVLDGRPASCPEWCVAALIQIMSPSFQLTTSLLGRKSTEIIPKTDILTRIGVGRVICQMKAMALVERRKPLQRVEWDLPEPVRPPESWVTNFGSLCAMLR